MAKFLIALGRADGANFDAGSTLAVSWQHVFAGTTNEARMGPLARGGTQTVADLYVRVITNPLGNASTFSFRDNGADGNQSVSIGAGATGVFEDTSNTDTIADGESINSQFVVGNDHGSTLTVTVASYTLDGGVTTSLWRGSQDTRNANSTFYVPFFGFGITMTSTETRSEFRARHPQASYHNLHVYIVSNGVNVGASVFRFRKNNANGNQVVSVPASSSGRFEDTTNSDTVDPGDDINGQWVTGDSMMGTDQITFGHEGVWLDTGVSIVGSSNDDELVTHIPSGVTRYIVLTQIFNHGRSTTTEANTQLVPRFKCTASNYYLNVSSNTLNAATVFDFRKGGASTNLSISVPGSTSGIFEDLGNAELVEATDAINHRYDSTASSSGVLNNRVITVQLQEWVDSFPVSVSEDSFLNRDPLVLAY